MHRIRDDVELWSGNRESWRGAFWGWESLFAWALRSHFRHRWNWPRRFGGDPRFVRLRSVPEARDWLQLAAERRGEDDPWQVSDCGGVAMNDEMSTSLGEFLVGLGENFDTLQAFLENPERTMAEAGLSAEDRDLVLKGDVEQLQRTIQEQLGDSPIAFIVYPHNWPIVHW
jgi:hypothetical protein